MSNDQRNLSDDPTSQSPPREQDNGERIDVLMSRLVDGQATDADRAAFHAAAEDQPQLWRELSLRYEQMGLLMGATDPLLSHAEQIDVHAADRHPQLRSRSGAAESSSRRFWPLVGTLGWAAAIVLCFALVAMILMQQRADKQPSADSALVDEQSTQSLSHEQHLEAYLEAPFVTHEFPMMILEETTLPDGSRQVRQLRRIEELRTIPPQEATESRSSSEPADSSM